MPKKGQRMSEEEKQRRRKALLKHWHGEDWTEEDQKQFDRERNTRLCKGRRDRHREAYTEYIRDYQKKFREANPYYYGWKQWNRTHEFNKLTYEQYIQMRIEKENKKQKLYDLQKDFE